VGGSWAPRAMAAGMGLEAGGRGWRAVVGDDSDGSDGATLLRGAMTDPVC
jgi:hypothetical protein